MTVAKRLADRGAMNLDPARADTLRMLTLSNGAAAAGNLGSVGRLIDSLPFDSNRSPGDDAYLRAARLHARTQDDFHPSGRVHIGAVALAATLALAEHVEDRLLECLAAGYEVMCAVGTAYAADAQARGFRPTGIFAPFGAAASAATALQLDRDGIANAISLAASMTAGTNQAWVSGTDEWLLELAQAARNGVEAALLSQAGATGAPDAIEGAAGWARAFCDDAEATKIARVLDDGTSLLAAVAVKPYPVSGIAQVPTHLACSMHRRLGSTRPQAVTLRLSSAEAHYPGSANRGPFRSRSDALMSLTFCVACGIRSGVLLLSDTDDPNRPELREVMEAVRLEPDERLGETECVLSAAVDDDHVELAGAGDEIFHPSWAALVGEADQLANRSEAPAATVHALADALAREAPDAREIADLLGARGS